MDSACREMKSLRSLFALQARWSRIPRCNQLLIEQIETRGGHQTFVFPFEGRLVHEGLAALIAYRISKLQKVSFTLACNDYGIVLQSPQQVDFAHCIANGLFDAEQLEADLLASLNETEMARRQFRQIARSRACCGRLSRTTT